MRTRVALVAAGVLVMAYGIGGALADPDLEPGGVLLFLAGVLIGHDAVWMPAVLLAGAAIARFVPAEHRPAVRTAAISAAAVTFVAFPLVLGFGRAADNPSVLPPPYGRNLAAILLLIAVATAVGGRWRTARKNSERPGGAGTEPDGR